MDLSPMAGDPSDRIWPFVDLSSSMPADFAQEDDNPMTSAGLGRARETNTRRKMYPKEQWMALKPVIQRLYVYQGQTFPKVAGYLYEHYGFNPTKKQFLRRISEWGFEKNVKRDERRAILKGLSDGIQEGEFEAKFLRGRRLDKAKIERWRKREGMTGAVSYIEDGKPSGTLDRSLDLGEGGLSAPSQVELRNANEPAKVMAVQGSHLISMAIRLEQTFNPWLAVDVVGSPGLTGLVGALTLDCCESIPDLDLSLPYPEDIEAEEDLTESDESSSTIIEQEAPPQQHQPVNKDSRPVLMNITAVPTGFLNQSQQRIPGPLDEVYPFPKIKPQRELFKDPRTDHLISAPSLRLKESECRRKFQNLKDMERSEITNLVENMQSIAWRHRELCQDHLEEIWWHRIVTASFEIKEYQPLEVLRASIWVIDAVRLQGRYHEALELHQNIYHKMMSLLGPDHQLTIIATKIFAALQGDLGAQESETTIYRELLQALLRRFGTRSRQTLEVLLCLGKSLISCGNYREAEIILTIRQQLDFEISNYPDRSTLDIQNAVETMSSLAWSLTEQQNYNDSKHVLDTAEKLFKDAISIENPWSWNHFFQRACILREEGRLFESEEILRAILRHHPDFAEVDGGNVTEALASLLMETGRLSEAAALWKKLFFTSAERYGIEHTFTLWPFAKLGSCYIQLGRYDDAILHFQDTSQRIARRNGGTSDSSAESTKFIQSWICEVESIREAAKASEI